MEHDGVSRVCVVEATIEICIQEKHPWVVTHGFYGFNQVRLRCPGHDNQWLPTWYTLQSSPAIG